MTEKVAPSFNVDIHMAGDINLAAGVIQRYAADTGMCISLTPQSFIYTGGREEGFKVGFINYPRFPKDPGDIVARARDLASVLRVQLGQHSYSIVTPIETIWVSRRPEDQTPTPAPSLSGIKPAVTAQMEIDQNVTAADLGVNADPSTSADLDQALSLMDRCVHDGGFDRETGPIGCYLGDKCVCIGIYPLIASARAALSATATEGCK